jgi:hypothetical protein
MPVSSCSRGSIENPRTGRCKGINSFTLDELKKLARQQKVSTTGTKAEIGQRLIKKFASRVGRSRSRSAPKKKTAATRGRRTASKSRGRKTKSKSASRKVARPRKVTRSRSRSSEYYRSLAPRRVRTSYGPYTISRSRESYPTKGRGSFQKRHHSSKRVGPSLPANAHCWERARGNDGNMWQSRPDKNGRCAWRRL